MAQDDRLAVLRVEMRISTVLGKTPIETLNRDTYPILFYETGDGNVGRHLGFRVYCWNLFIIDPIEIWN